jgi:fructuronate reductase
VRGYGAEAGATLSGPTADYIDQVVERFRNPAMWHRLRQIGSDGSVKIPERWFGALRDLRAAGVSTPLLELSLAAWVNAIDADGLRFGMTDPLAEALAGCRTGTSGQAEVVARLLRFTGAPDLAEQADLTTSVAGRLPGLRAGRLRRLPAVLLGRRPGPVA